MSEPTEPVPIHAEEPPSERCPACDSVIPAGSDRCLMCGTEVEASLEDNPAAETDLGPDSDEVNLDKVEPELSLTQNIVVSQMKERESQVTFWFTAGFAIIIVVLGALVLRYQSPTVAVALIPTGTPLPPTLTNTPTRHPEVTSTDSVSADPTGAPTVAPSSTPRPPQLHVVNPGETLTGLALRYRVSVESIADLNALVPDAQIQVQQNLEIPWPTATPPLVAVAVTVRGVNIVADPANCEWYEVRGGDSILSIAAKHDVDFELFMLVNRISEQTILFQEDSLCIPEIKIGGFLPPTPGPSPTPSPTSLPSGPHLLYPVQNASVGPLDDVVTLQWTAVKDLDESEWYMVELTNLDDIDGLARREFTRDTSLQLPASASPANRETARMRWRVSIVQVVGQRSDGKFIFGYGGEASEGSYFTWTGGPQDPVNNILSASATPTPGATP